MDSPKEKQISKFNYGFTLIELLVSVVIIGLLSAIALPSYLNQTNKVKGAEAKSNLGTINRAQQAYYLENSVLANSLSFLDAKIYQRYYNYSISGVSSNYVTTTTTTQQSDLKAHSSRMEQSGNNFLQIICESINTVTINSVATSPTVMTGCPANYNSVQ